MISSSSSSPGFPSPSLRRRAAFRPTSTNPWPMRFLIVRAIVKSYLEYPPLPSRLPMDQSNSLSWPPSGAIGHLGGFAAGDICGICPLGPPPSLIPAVPRCPPLRRFTGPRGGGPDRSGRRTEFFAWPTTGEGDAPRTFGLRFGMAADPV